MDRIYWTVIQYAADAEKESTYFGPFERPEEVTTIIEQMDTSFGFCVAEWLERNGRLLQSTFGEWNGEGVIV